ncbi:MAG: LamG domain-containing protein [Myxococcota bacterium]
MPPLCFACVWMLSCAGRTEDEPGRFYAHYTQLEIEDQPEGLSGPLADVVVNVGTRGQLVFSRETSYRPVWTFGDDGTEAVPHLSGIAGDGPPEGRFDRSNQYTYARVIEQADDEIVVHWRYYPDLADLSPAGVVHEHYIVSRDGTVVRTHREGTSDYEAWVDPLNRTTQTFTLTPRGIEDLQTTPPSRSDPAPPVGGRPLLEAPLPVEPLARWAFDEGRGRTAGPSGTVDRPLWKAGVSGTALGFDGYGSAVRVDAPPAVSDAVTVGAWVAVGARPWNTAPVVDHAAGDRGYALDVDAYGQLTFTVEGVTLTADEPLERHRWAHVAGVSGPEGMGLYVDGAPVATGPAADAPRPPDGPLLIGLNRTPVAATDAVRFDDLDEFHHFSGPVGFEGLIDEVVVFGEALDATDVAAWYATQSAGAQSPDLDPRRLPDLGTDGASFGAVHTRLAYHDLWDRQWRVSDTEDVVVRFDDQPTAFVYWRGTTHGMNAVTEGVWMSDQSVEIIIPDEEEEVVDTVTLSEHMSDKQALRSHVRVIENTAARVVVHWRYGVGDVFGTLIDARGFVDERHTIYPDGIAVRDVFYHVLADEGGMEFYHDFQLLVEPDDDPADFVDLTAVSLADLSGPVADLTWPLAEGRNVETGPERGNIAVLNTRTAWRIFGIAQGGGFYPAGGGGEISPYVDWNGQDFPFAGPWNHWPVAQIPSDGRFATAYDRVAHFAVGSLESFEYGTGSMLVGFTQGDAGSLVDVARSWRNAPAVRRRSGLRDGDYDVDQRAYTFVRTGDEMAFTVDASPESPMVHPCFLIRDWNDDRPAVVRADGSVVDDVRQGVTVDAEGNRMLVLFVEASRQSPTAFTLSVRP